MLKESKVVIIVVMQLIYKYDRQSISNMADIQRLCVHSTRASKLTSCDVINK